MKTRETVVCVECHVTQFPPMTMLRFCRRHYNINCFFVKRFTYVEHILLPMTSTLVIQFLQSLLFALSNIASSRVSPLLMSLLIMSCQVMCDRSPVCLSPDTQCSTVVLLFCYICLHSSSEPAPTISAYVPELSALTNCS